MTKFNPEETALSGRVHLEKAQQDMDVASLLTEIVEDLQDDDGSKNKAIGMYQALVAKGYEELVPAEGKEVDESYFADHAVDFANDAYLHLTKAAELLELGRSVEDVRGVVQDSSYVEENDFFEDDSVFELKNQYRSNNSLKGTLKDLKSEFGAVIDTDYVEKVRSTQ